VDAGKRVTLCDLRIFMNQAAEPVPPQDPAFRVNNRQMLMHGGRALRERPVRAMNVIACLLTCAAADGRRFAFALVGFQNSAANPDLGI
jgi:hypothetical protein